MIEEPPRGICELCETEEGIAECINCEKWYCDNCSAEYNQFSQIDYNCCKECQYDIENGPQD